MECKRTLNRQSIQYPHLVLSQVSMGFLSIGGSASQFPDKSASYPRGITQITG